MGIDTNGMQFLLYAKSQGVDYKKTMMIGRQAIRGSRQQLLTNLASFGYSCEEQIDSILPEGKPPYAEGLFNYLGGQEVHSIDNSDYENATHIHDMNDPISEENKSQYSTVFDSGSLEHIFNFPTAIKNCMEMITIGGHYLSITPANNFMGHGFYQFSPDLFFRIFTKDNGFKIENVFIVEKQHKSQWHTVIDPKDIGKNFTLRNNKQTYLMIIAKKLDNRGIFQSPPQQSDCALDWELRNKHESQPGKRTSVAKQFIPASLRDFSKTIRRQKLKVPKKNPKFFVPFDPKSS